MTGAVISQRVLQFIAEQIDTVPQLECVLLLHQYPSRAWSAEEVAARIYISPQAAREILEILQRRGLIAAASDPSRYLFDPGGTAGDELIGEVAREYQRHLVPLATFIHSKPSASVREFARAFDLKKER